MTARTGMANLITTLRAWADAGTAEFVKDSTTYFTDDHLQAVLDTYREDIAWQPLTIQPRTDVGGTVVYYDYYAPPGYWEEATSGSAAWMVQASTGADAGTGNYTVNYTNGHIAFTADQEGTAYYLSGRRYDLHRAAAEIWRRKAANVASRFDIKTDNHDLKRSQLMQHYTQMAFSFEKQAPARVVYIERGDAW